MEDNVDEIIRIPQSPFLYIEEGVCVKSLHLEQGNWVVHNAPYQAWTTSAEIYSDLRLALRVFKRRDPSIWWIKLPESTIRDILSDFYNAQLTLMISDELEHGSGELWLSGRFSEFHSFSVLNPTCVSFHSFNVPTGDRKLKLNLHDRRPYPRYRSVKVPLVLTRDQIDACLRSGDNNKIPKEYTWWSISPGEMHGMYWMAKPAGAQCYSTTDVLHIQLKYPLDLSLVGMSLNKLVDVRRPASNIWNEVIKTIDRTNNKFIAYKPRNRRKGTNEDIS